MQLTKSLSLRETEIPLYLLPQVITRQIHLKGAAVYRISVKRTHWHHYNVSVRTKAIKKELSPLRVVNLAILADDPGEGRCGLMRTDNGRGGE
jgi:hypothetical protein